MDVVGGRGRWQRARRLRRRRRPGSNGHGTGEHDRGHRGEEQGARHE
jgi:hypothetical protein